MTWKILITPRSLVNILLRFLGVSLYSHCKTSKHLCPNLHLLLQARNMNLWYISIQQLITHYISIQQLITHNETEARQKHILHCKYWTNLEIQHTWNILGDHYYAHFMMLPLSECSNTKYKFRNVILEFRNANGI